MIVTLHDQMSIQVGRVGQRATSGGDLRAEEGGPVS